jgi:hypothetical protein
MRLFSEVSPEASGFLQTGLEKGEQQENPEGGRTQVLGRKRVLRTDGSPCWRGRSCQTGPKRGTGFFTWP